MKFKNSSLTVFLISSFAIANGFMLKVFAASPAPTSETIANKIDWPVGPGFETVPAMISTLSGLLFPLVGIILFFMIVYGGITKMTAAGDAEKEKKAMEILKNAVIGTVIIVLARIIVDTISAILGGPGL